MLDLFGVCSGLEVRRDDIQRRFETALECIKEKPWFITARLKGDTIVCVISSLKDLYDDAFAWVLLMGNPKDAYLMGLKFEYHTKVET